MRLFLRIKGSRLKPEPRDALQYSELNLQDNRPINTTYPSLQPQIKDRTPREPNTHTEKRNMRGLTIHSRSRSSVLQGDCFKQSYYTKALVQHLKFSLRLEACDLNRPQTGAPMNQFVTLLYPLGNPKGRLGLATANRRDLAGVIWNALPIPQVILGIHASAGLPQHGRGPDRLVHPV